MYDKYYFLNAYIEINIKETFIQQIILGKITENYKKSQRLFQCFLNCKA